MNVIPAQAGIFGYWHKKVLACAGMTCVGGFVLTVIASSATQSSSRVLVWEMDCV